MAHVANYRQVGVTLGAEEAKGAAPAIAVPTTPIGPEIVAPSKEFTAPSSSFLFVDEPRRTSIMQYLPSRPVAERFLEQYWEAVHYMCRVVHRPTFERQWAQFWDSIQVGLEPPASLQALVMGVLLSAAISMAEDRIVYEFGAVKQQLVDSFRQGTEMALYKANFLRTTKLHTLQAFVLYLVRCSSSRAASNVTGRCCPPRGFSLAFRPHRRRDPAGGVHGAAPRRNALRALRRGGPRPKNNMVPALLPGHPDLRGHGAPSADPQGGLRHQIAAQRERH
jgi:hypothetical protein